MMPFEGYQARDWPPGHMEVYVYMFYFGLRFPLDPFIVNIFKASNICLSQLTPLG